MIDHKIHPDFCSNIFDVFEKLLQKHGCLHEIKTPTQRKGKNCQADEKVLFFFARIVLLRNDFFLPLLPLVECFYLKYKQCNVHTVVNLALVS